MVVKEILHSVLLEKLTGVTYHPENTSQWTREIADEIKGRLKGTIFYLIMVFELI